MRLAQGAAIVAVAPSVMRLATSWREKHELWFVLAYISIPRLSERSSFGSRIITQAARQQAPNLI